MPGDQVSARRAFYFSNKANRRERLRAWVSAIRRESTREEALNTLLAKTRMRVPYWEGGDFEGLPCDPGSELRLGGKERVKEEQIQEMV